MTLEPAISLMRLFRIMLIVLRFLCRLLIYCAYCLHLRHFRLSRSLLIYCVTSPHTLLLAPLAPAHNLMRIFRRLLIYYGTCASCAAY